MNWFRVYHDIIDDPKILALPCAYRWHVVALFAVSSRQTPRGSLPSLAEIACHLRVRKTEAEKIINKLIDLKFIDTNFSRTKLSIHGWDQRQFKSDDVSARTKVAMQRSRERSIPEIQNVHVNAPETDTEQNRSDPPLSPLGGNVEISIPIPKEFAVGPEFTKVGELAIQLSADLSFGRWVSDMGRAGFKADWIEQAIRLSSGNGKLSKPYAHKILQGWLSSGGPPVVASHAANGSPSAKTKPMLTPEEVEAIDARWS